MQRIVAAGGEVLIDGDQVLDVADLGREQDLVAAHAELFGPGRRQQRRLDDGFALHGGGGDGMGRDGVLVHEAGQQFLVERAPVDPDAHRLVVAIGDLDERRELRIALGLEADIARIDAILRQRLGAGRMIGEELVADIVEVAHQRHVIAHRGEAVADDGTAAALSSRSTVMRTISEPARASCMTWRTVASISAVSVLVIDWTTTGAPPPTITPPTLTPTDCLRGAGPAISQNP